MLIEKNILLNNLSKIEHLTFNCECCKKGVKIFDGSKYLESESEFSRSFLAPQKTGPSILQVKNL